MSKKKQSWHNTRHYSEEQLETAGKVLAAIQAGTPTLSAIRSHPLKEGGYIAKHTLVYVYRHLVAKGVLLDDPHLLARIRMKPVRSLSGVSTVTVLTEPHACPGECIFCPNDPELPKSYLKEEPGAARAYQNLFDPYLQVQSRLDSYRAIGHPVDKIELLILGGSWSAYSREYRELFIKRCFDAMNGKSAATLAEAQKINEDTESRNVGLVVETRPDMITPSELEFFRHLGVTKVQMGAQSFDDRILALNCRGHSVSDTLNATALLRAAGFKIVLHWMPNLMGASLDTDRQDFQHMWSDGFCPDEIKIYPTQLLKEAPLYQSWQEGKYHPYSTRDLINLLADLKPTIPPYCRVNRIIRDIPSDYIMAGSKRSSLRQDVHQELDRRNQRCRCIRCREIRSTDLRGSALTLDDHVYQAADAEEHFIHYHTPQDRLAGYLRLSLPLPAVSERETVLQHLIHLMPELDQAALIREVHIFGQSLEVGSDLPGAAQHRGLGSTLIEQSEQIAREHNFKNLVVIAAIGTRKYYEKRGFVRSGLYMSKKIS